jgi:hypothetical protein
VAEEPYERQPWRKLSPQIAALQDAADVEQGKLNDLMVMAAAERPVGELRREELTAAWKTAQRRWWAAKGQLTRAQKDGDADKIQKARQRVDERYAEFDRVLDASLKELQAGTQVSLDRMGAMLDQMGVAWAADKQVTDAISADRTEGVRHG